MRRVPNRGIKKVIKRMSSCSCALRHWNRRDAVTDGCLCWKYQQPLSTASCRILKQSYFCSWSEVSLEGFHLWNEKFLSAFLAFSRTQHGLTCLEFINISSFPSLIFSFVRVEEGTFKFIFLVCALPAPRRFCTELVLLFSEIRFQSLPISVCFARENKSCEISPFPQAYYTGHLKNVLI